MHAGSSTWRTASPTSWPSQTRASTACVLSGKPRGHDQHTARSHAAGPPENFAVDDMIRPEVSAQEEDAYTLGVQAILWGYPMVCTARTAEAALRMGSSNINTFRRIPKLKNAGDRDVTRPNNVTIDAHGWLDLRKGPVVLHVPALAERR